MSEESERILVDGNGEVIENDEPEDEGDEEEEASFEGAKTPAEQAAVDEAALAKLDKALTAEDKRHQAALGKALGDSWPEHVRCAMCDGVGFLGPEAARALTTAQWGELLQVAAMLVTEDYVQDQNYETCQNCAGKGQTRSGATNSDHYLKLCDGCQGNGYVQRAPQVPTYSMPAPIQVTNGAEPMTQASYGSPEKDDAWGRHAGHPHYGIDPRYVVVP